MNHKQISLRLLLILMIASLCPLGLCGTALGQGGTGKGPANSNSNKKPAPTRRAVKKNNSTTATSTAEIDRKLSELKKKRSALLEIHTAEWPEVKQLDAQIAALEKQRADILGTTGASPRIVAPDPSSIPKPSPSPAPATLEADPVLFPPDKRNLQTVDPKPAGNEAAGEKIYAGKEVDQKARILSKPAPMYTEDARKNQVSGTVILRAVLTASGQVTNIRVVSGLPYGLTERAIAAARQVKFTPALKDGNPVSQFIQFEYNFSPY
ncbi:MAG: energy transducer TonB [Acidobacteriota bacterium]